MVRPDRVFGDMCPIVLLDLIGYFFLRIGNGLLMRWYICGGIIQDRHEGAGVSINGFHIALSVFPCFLHFQRLFHMRKLAITFSFQQKVRLVISLALFLPVDIGIDLPIQNFFSKK